MKPFYYVQRVGDRAATVKHYTLESAYTESLRLAGQHPGATFEILQCVGITRTTEPSTFWNDGFGPPKTLGVVDEDCDGWIKNEGALPCDFHDRIDLKFMVDDESGRDVVAGHYNWVIRGKPYDITHWRYVK